ncbi:DUF6531 domain-containing protein [Actinomyces israelii]|uniref:DUF6531 domain-containing protein n=1 Tax=Actinomyces israelii TaxID=1659 RepID=A0ABT4IAN4_9ACTO|nr:DUF6531 domain-containing protein [Actinomyces israelii]MCZ0858803.1 DUF6531 domain-containing protein [Actinomyces israelii]
MPQGSDQVGPLVGIDEDVPYSAADANALAAACRASATLIEGQAGTRAWAVSTAETDFEGCFSRVFADNAGVQVADATNLVRALRDVATKVDALTEEAGKEQERRETGRRWKRDHDNKSWAEKTWDAVFHTDPVPIGPEARPLPQTVPEPVVGAREAPWPGSVLGQTSGTSSAAPADLRSFATASQAANDELAGDPAALRGRYETFEATCTWGAVYASGVFKAYDTYLANNVNDVTWAGTVAEAFEAVGGAEGVSTVADAAIQASLEAAGVTVCRSQIEIDPAMVQGGQITSGYADDPVNTLTGSFVEPEIDLAFTGGAGALALIRVYSSSAREPGAFGPGWASALESRIELDDEAARWVQADGAVAVFPRAGQGWERATGESRWLEREDADGGGGRLVVSDNAGGRWVFTASGVLVSSSRGEGTGVAYVRDEGRVVRMEHERGRSIRLVWDGPRVVAAETSDGRRVSYVYDEAGRLTGAQAPRGSRGYEWGEAGLIVRVTDADGVVEADNTYDEAGRVRTQRSAFGRTTRYSYLPGRVTQVADADGERSNVWTYDRHGRLIGVVDAHGKRQSAAWDRWGNQVVATDRDGGRTVRTFDERGHMLIERTPTGMRTTSTWDDQDRLTQVRITPSSAGRASGKSSEKAAGEASAPESVVRYGYRGRDRHPSTITDPEGGVTRLRWEAGLLTRLEDPTGVTVSLSHDEHGDVVGVTDASGATARLERDEAGRVVAAVTPLGHRTRFAYDEAGMCTSRTDPDGAVWRFEYTASGRLAARIDPLGGRTQISYGDGGQEEAVTDPLGRTLRRSVDDLGNLAGVELPDGSRWDFVHDALSRLTSFTDAAGGTWQLEYDSVGRLAGTVDPVGVKRTIRTGPDGQPVEFADPEASWTARYDGLGRPEAAAGPDGEATVVAYDRCGRVVRSVDPLGAEVSYRYDAAGRLVGVTQPDGSSYSYEYDACGRWCATVSTGGARYELVYDADSRIVGEVWPTGERVVTDFDVCGRPVRRVEPGAGVRRVAYDKCGRVARVRDAWYGTRRFGYDACGQVVAVTNALGGVTRLEWDEAGRLVSTTDPTGAVTRRAYDPMGRLTAITDPLGRTTRLSYDRTGRITRRLEPGGGELSWVYDTAGRLVQERSGERVLARICRDLTGRTMTVRSDTGEDVHLVWDAAGRLISSRTGTLATSMSYDACGRRTSMTTPDGARTSYEYDQEWNQVASDSPLAGRVSIERDLIGRPVSAHGPGLEAWWTWRAGFVVREEVVRAGRRSVTVLERDEAGRITCREVDGRRTCFAYDDAGQLIGVTGPDGRRTELVYDPAGRLVTESGPGAQTGYAYDAAGRLLERTGPLGATRYRYDAAGRRTSQAGPDGERRYSYDERGDLTRVVALHHDGDRVLAERVWDIRRDAAGEITSVGPAATQWDPLDGTPVRAGQLDAVGAAGVLATRRRAPDDGAPASSTPAGAPGQADGATGAPTDGPGRPGPDLEGSGERAWTGVSWADWDQRPADPWALAAGVDIGEGLSLGAGGSISVEGLDLLGARAYDPASRSFLSRDPLASPLGAVWGGNPYSYAGNEPVGRADPAGLAPVSDADLAAYNQSHAGLLSRAWDAASSWVSDNWQYVAAAAVVTAGVVMCATGVGAGIGAGILIGAAASGVFSAGAQYVTTGTVDLKQVALDTAIGGVAGAAGAGVGAGAARLGQAAQAAQAAGRTGMGAMGRNVLTGVADGGADGGASGGLSYLTGPGPHTVGGLAEATGEGALKGGASGGAGGAPHEREDLERRAGRVRGRGRRPHQAHLQCVQGLLHRRHAGDHGRRHHQAHRAGPPRRRDPGPQPRHRRRRTTPGPRHLHPPGHPHLAADNQRRRHHHHHRRPPLPRRDKRMGPRPRPPTRRHPPPTQPR